MEENLPQPQVSVNPVPAVQPPPPKKFPLNLILIILIVIVIFSTGVLFAVKNESNRQIPQPTPQTSIKPSSLPTPIDQTSNWKTYNDSELGFSLKYPFNPNFGATGYGHIKIINGVMIGPLQSEADFYLKAYDNPKKLLPLGWVEAKNYRVEGLGLEISDSSGKFHPLLLTKNDVKITKRQVSGQEAIEVTLSEISPKLKEYPHNPQVILFTSPDGKQMFLVQDLTNQILSTLKFIDKTNSVLK